MPEPIDVVVIGAGTRGNAYARFATEYPDALRIVAVAEPHTERRERFAAAYQLSPERIFADWRELLAANGQPLARAALNCTMDRDHYASTLGLLRAGYDVLLEKPMSPVLAENVALVAEANVQGRLLQVCHVLRYTAFWRTLREVVRSGKLGRIVSVTHNENLAFWHMAHSFVRGNWRNVAEAGPMILSKCCHDFDILLWLLQQDVIWLSSFGTLTHFRSENAPAGAPLRCTDGCPVAADCKYDATRIYGQDGDRFPLSIISPTPTREARLAALTTSLYGRCVYFCDNDVVDHQTVNMLLADGTTVTLTMNGQGDEECRTMRWDGTRATLYGKFSSRDPYLRIHYHLSGVIEDIPIVRDNSSGHGGGDFGIVRGFLNALNGIADDSLTTAHASLESHLLAFAAEEARLIQRVVHMPTFRADAMRS